MKELRLGMKIIFGSDDDVTITINQIKQVTDRRFVVGTVEEVVYFVWHLDDYYFITVDDEEYSGPEIDSISEVEEGTLELPPFPDKFNIYRRGKKNLTINDFLYFEELMLSKRRFRVVVKTWENLFAVYYAHTKSGSYNVRREEIRSEITTEIGFNSFFLILTEEGLTLTEDAESFAEVVDIKFFPENITKESKIVLRNIFDIIICACDLDEAFNWAQETRLFGQGRVD